MTISSLIQPGAIGLGLDHNLPDLIRLGAATYERWFTLGLTRIRPEQANTSAIQFKLSFIDAVERASQVVFDLTDFDVNKGLADGPLGFIHRNYTNAELYLIVTNVTWLTKTLFLDRGRVVKVIQEDQKVIGFILASEQHP